MISLQQGTTMAPATGESTLREHVGPYSTRNRHIRTLQQEEAMWDTLGSSCWRYMMFLGPRVTLMVSTRSSAIPLSGSSHGLTRTRRAYGRGAHPASAGPGLRSKATPSQTIVRSVRGTRRSSLE